MRALLALMVVLIVVPTTRAADPDVQNFVDFQIAKLTTYPEAYDKHLETKRPVIVWVRATDAQFDAWVKTKDVAIHCFVNEFTHIKEGYVIGDERNKQFVVLAKGPYVPDMVDRITAALAPPRPRPTQTFTLPLQNCPNGQCPRR